MIQQSWGRNIILHLMFYLQLNFLKYQGSSCFIVINQLVITSTGKESPVPDSDVITSTGKESPVPDSDVITSTG
jgi:hypothetical protein